LSTAAAARRCGSLHNPYRSTKLNADDRRRRDDVGWFVLPMRNSASRAYSEPAQLAALRLLASVRWK
jgi:hypothetical protein